MFLILPGKTTLQPRQAQVWRYLIIGVELLLFETMFDRGRSG
jgi:hypothetical protein